MSSALLTVADLRGDLQPPVCALRCAVPPVSPAPLEARVERRRAGLGKRAG